MHRTQLTIFGGSLCTYEGRWLRRDAEPDSLRTVLIASATACSGASKVIDASPRGPGYALGYWRDSGGIVTFRLPFTV